MTSVRFVPLIAGTIAALCAWPGVAFAEPGIVIYAEERLAFDEDGKVRESRVQIAGDRLRMDNVRGNDLAAVVYDRGAGHFLLIDRKKETYRVLPKAALETALQRLNQAVDLARGRMNELSPDNRDQIEALLDAGIRALDKKIGEGGPAMVFQPTGRTETVGVWPAQIYEGMTEGSRQIELFTTDVEKVAIPPEQLALLLEVRGVFDSGIGKWTGIKISSALFPAPGTRAEGDYSGFPVRRIRYDGDEAVADWRLVRIEEEDLAESLFQAPEGYEKQKLSLPDLNF